MTFDVTEDRLSIQNGVRAPATQFDDHCWRVHEGDGRFPQEWPSAMADGTAKRC